MDTQELENLSRKINELNSDGQKFVCQSLLINRQVAFQEGDDWVKFDLEDMSDEILHGLKHLVKKIQLR